MKVIQVGKEIRKRSKNPIKLLSIPIVLISIISCGQKKKDVYVNHDFIGITLPKLLDSLGSPHSDKNIKITKASNLYEYQSGLLSLYNRISENDTIFLKEIIWKDLKESKCFWFEQKEGKWVVVDNLFWKKGVKF